MNLFFHLFMHELLEQTRDGSQNIGVSGLHYCHLNCLARAINNYESFLCHIGSQSAERLADLPRCVLGSSDLEVL